MNTYLKKIGPLDKVLLKYTIQSSDGSRHSVELDNEVTIIYGIGTAGITAFEQYLYEKTKGDKFSINVNTGQNHELFGHLQCVLFSRQRLILPCVMHFTIQEVSSATPQEVIKLMAQLSSCGSGCDCGCC